MWFILKAYKDLCKKNKWTPDCNHIKFLNVIEDWGKTLKQRSFLFNIFGFKGGYLKPLPPFRGGVYIYGAVGQGKTVLMKLIYDSCPLTKKKYYHFNDFMAYVHNLLAVHGKKQTFLQPIERVIDHISQSTEILFLDELQVMEIADAMILARLFKGLLTKKVLVIITSNQPPEDLYKNGLHYDRFRPFVDFLSTALCTYHLQNKENKDYRQASESPIKVFFNHSDHGDLQNLNALFHELTKGIYGPKRLQLNQRFLVVPEASETVARFSFHDLCGKPLGASDYAAISRQFKIVFITDIPVLTAQLKNEARQFMVLIDIFYEAKIKLVASFCAPVKELYQDKTPHSLPFTRTASRLEEMQSDCYWR